MKSDSGVVVVGAVANVNVNAKLKSFHVEFNKKMNFKATMNCMSVYTPKHFSSL